MDKPFRHRSRAWFRYKIGDPNIINTEITKPGRFVIFVVEIWQQVVKAFPLVPAFHRALFSTSKLSHRVILNLGGIANVSMLPANNPADRFGVFGLIRDPRNILMDAWCHRHTGHPYG